MPNGSDRITSYPLQELQPTKTIDDPEIKAWLALGTKTKKKGGGKKKKGRLGEHFVIISCLYRILHNLHQFPMFLSGTLLQMSSTTAWLFAQVRRGTRQMSQLKLSLRTQQMGPLLKIELPPPQPRKKKKMISFHCRHPFQFWYIVH